RIGAGPRLRGPGRKGRRACLVSRQALGYRTLCRNGFDFTSRACSVRARRVAAVRGERGLRPVVENAFGCARNELPGAIVDQANDLSARFVVETPRGKDLRDLLPELAITFERGLDVLADSGAETALKGHAMSCPFRRLFPPPLQIWQCVSERALDCGAHTALQVFVCGFFKGGVGGNQ